MDPLLVEMAQQAAHISRSNGLRMRKGALRQSMELYGEVNCIGPSAPGHSGDCSTGKAFDCIVDRILMLQASR